MALGRWRPPWLKSVSGAQCVRVLCAVLWTQSPFSILSLVLGAGGGPHHLPKLQDESSAHTILRRNIKHNDSSVIFLTPASHSSKIKNLTQPNLLSRMTILGFVSRH